MGDLDCSTLWGSSVRDQNQVCLALSRFLECSIAKGSWRMGLNSAQNLALMPKLSISFPEKHQQQSTWATHRHWYTGIVGMMSGTQATGYRYMQHTDVQTIVGDPPSPGQAVYRHACYVESTKEPTVYQHQCVLHIPMGCTAQQLNNVVSQQWSVYSVQ